MPVVNRIADFAADMAAWRQHLHTIPELGLDCPKTCGLRGGTAARIRRG